MALRDHLIAGAVTLVVMEATGNYWKPFFYLLEDGPFEVMLVNARHVKNLPGRIRGKAPAAIETALDKGEIDPLTVLRVVADSPTLIGPTVPAAILDAEMNLTRIGLPPSPPPRGLDAQLASLRDPPPSDIERAETLMFARLVKAAGLDATRADS